MRNFNKTNTNVLVTQAGTRNGFVVTYSLGKMGVPVYCADVLKVTQTRMSRFCQGYSTYPSPHLEPDIYFEEINRLIQHYDIGLLFPAYDEMIFLSQHRARLVKPDILISSEGDKLGLVHNKAHLHELSKQIGCNTPTTVELAGEADVEAALAQLSFPMVLKPERGGGGWGVSFIKDPDELIRTWEAFDVSKHKNRLFVQQYIEGPLYGYGVLCNQGTILASNCYQTVRQYPLGTGTPSFRRGTVVEEIENQAELLFGHLNWTGVCQCDFLQDQNDGKVYLIDVNPRFWGSTAHALASGINFPFLLYMLGTGQHDGRVIRRTGTGVTSSWFWGDAAGMVKRLRNEKGKIRILREHAMSWLRAYFDDFRLDDPLPFFGYPLQKLSSAGKSDNSKGF